MQGPVVHLMSSLYPSLGTSIHLWRNSLYSTSALFRTRTTSFDARVETDMAEPQPSGIQEGDQGPSAVPASKEDRKTANALSNLDAKADNDTTVKQADTEALGKAMKNLDVGGSAGKEPQVKAVKIDAADVTLLVSTLPPS